MGILRASHLDGIWTAIVEDKFVVRSFTKRALFERLWWNDRVVFDAVHAEFCCTSHKKRVEHNDVASSIIELTMKDLIVPIPLMFGSRQRGRQIRPSITRGLPLMIIKLHRYRTSKRSPRGGALLVLLGELPRRWEPGCPTAFGCCGHSIR